MDIILERLKRLPFNTVMAARKYGMDNISAPDNAHTGSKLCMAILRGDNMEAKKLLLSDRSGLNYQDEPDGWTPLIYSIYYANSRARQMLLDFDANINQEDFSGRTPLMFAAIRGDFELLNQLLSLGADPNAADHKHKNAMDFAIEYRQQKCITLLQQLLPQK